MDFVQFVKLPTAKLRENLQIMEEGNRLLKKWALQLVGKRKLRIFRERLFKGEFQDLIPAQDWEKIAKVKSIEVEMSQAFAPMVSLRAKVWATRIDGNQVHFYDIYQEANFAFEDALFGYLGEAKKAKFITYVWRVIDRRLRREIDNYKFQLVPPSADGARKLVQEYEKFQQKEACNRHVTFDEYIAQMELSEDEILTLTQALVAVNTETDVLWWTRKRGHEHNGNIIDYSAFAKLDEVVVEREVDNRELRRTLAKCIEIAQLTDFQKELLHAACTQENQGWKARIAKKYGFSRTRAGQAFKEACERLKLIYQREQDQ